MCLIIVITITPIITDVTRTANRERVPNGALPKLGRGPHSLMGRRHHRQRREAVKGYASLLHDSCAVNMLLPENVFLTDVMDARLIGQARYIQDYIHIAETTGTIFHRSWLLCVTKEYHRAQSLCVTADVLFWTYNAYRFEEAIIVHDLEYHCSLVGVTQNCHRLHRKRLLLIKSSSFTYSTIYLDDH